jgi:hypothetical protein
MAHRQKLKKRETKANYSRPQVGVTCRFTPAPPQRRNHIEEEPSEQDPKIIPANTADYTGGACTQRAHN